MTSAVAVLAGYVAALVFVFAYHAIHAAMFGTGAPGTAGTLVGLAFGARGAHRRPDRGALADRPVRRPIPLPGWPLTLVRSAYAIRRSVNPETGK